MLPFCGRPVTALLRLVRNPAERLPQNGSQLYVRLWTQNAGLWQTPIDYTFTAATAANSAASPSAVATAVMTTPAPGSTLSGGSATFSWTAGTGADGYWLDVGTSGPGSGNLSSVFIMSLSKALTGLPQNGSTLYVRLWTRIGGVWKTPIDYTYTSGP